MKKIRNLLTVLLALVLVLTMAACGEKDPMLGKYMLVDAADMLGEPMEIDGEYMVLEKDGKGTMYTYGMTSDMEWTCTGKDFSLTELGFDSKGIAEDGYIVLEYDGALCIFAKDGVKTPAVEDYFKDFDYFKEFVDGGSESGNESGGSKLQNTAAEETEEDDYWAGDWYGWYIFESASGEFADVEGYAFDCCANITRSGDTGTIIIWDDVFPKDDPMVAVDVSFGDGTTDYGAMMSESGYYADCEIGHADWIVDAGVVYPEISGDTKPIWINGTYVDPENSDNTFAYSFYLLPWGTYWDELIAEDDYWAPINYEDWYLPLIEAGEPMPDAMVLEGSDGGSDAPVDTSADNTPATPADSGTSEALGIVEKETLQAVYTWIDEGFREYKPTYEEVVEHMGGVEGRPYRPENWTDAKRNYIWSTQDYYETEITGEFLQCGFAVNEDGSLTITLYNPSYYLMK